jgi:hypothetical protein
MFGKNKPANSGKEIANPPPQSSTVSSSSVSVSGSVPILFTAGDATRELEARIAQVQKGANNSMFARSSEQDQLEDELKNIPLSSSNPQSLIGDSPRSSVSSSGSKRHKRKNKFSSSSSSRENITDKDEASAAPIDPFVVFAETQMKTKFIYYYKDLLSMVKSTDESFNKLVEHRNAGTLPKFLRPSLSPQFKMKILGKEVPQAQQSIDKVKDILQSAHKTILDTIIGQKINELNLLKDLLSSFLNEAKTQIYADAISAGISVEEHSKATAYTLIENYIKNAKAKNDLNVLNNVVKSKIDKNNSKINQDADMSSNVIDDNKSELVTLIQAEIQKALKRGKSPLKPILKQGQRQQQQSKNVQQQTRNRSRKKNLPPARSNQNQKRSGSRSRSHSRGQSRPPQVQRSPRQQRFKNRQDQDLSNEFNNLSLQPRRQTKDTRKEKGNRGNSTPAKSRSRSRSTRWKPKSSGQKQQARRNW